MGLVSRHARAGALGRACSLHGRPRRDGLRPPGRAAARRAARSVDRLRRRCGRLLGESCRGSVALERDAHVARRGLDGPPRRPVEDVSAGAYVMSLGPTPYREAWDLQRSLAAAVGQGAMPETIVLLEHLPVVTLGRRAEDGELHIPASAEVDVVETDRGGKSTYHAPGQLVCYPILDLTRHGTDVKRYCRDLEEALIRTMAPLGLEATRIDGLTGIWLENPPRKIASIGVHISKWITTHGYALNVDLDPAPFPQWITACGLEEAQFTTIARELGRPVTVDEVRPLAVAALQEVFDLELEALPAAEGPGLWPQPVHAKLAG